MKKLHSIAFCALITPAITLGTSSVLAQGPADEEIDREMQGTQQRDQESMQGMPGAQGEQSQMQNKGYLSAAPADGTHASNLIGAEVKTTNDEEVGSVSDLIIDDKGQVVAIVVGVGGFLGMGEKDVAIGWDDVTRSSSPDDKGLKINLTREGLMSAPEFKSAE
ncbi:MAG: PRC-barrel domain-containing protein [Chromatocurvus sp.]